MSQPLKCQWCDSAAVQKCPSETHNVCRSCLGCCYPKGSCPKCGVDECSYQCDDEPCYGQIEFETRDSDETDEWDLHSCEGHRGAGGFKPAPYKPRVTVTP